MTVLLSSASKRSRFLFDWSAAACLASPDMSLNALTGQVATFTRGSIKTGFDASGVVRTVADSLPAWQWATDPVSGLMAPGVLLEGARTNVVLWNRDLTNAAWTKTNTTAAKTQTGIDGVANSASLLTASAGNGTCLQAITLASSARYQSAYVKRVTGSGVINMTTDNGATWTAVTVTSAWTRVTIPTQTLANPTVGFRIVTNADAIAVDFAQNENGTYATSPIATTTVAVARTADALTHAINLVPGALTMYARFMDLSALDGAPANIASLGTPGNAGTVEVYRDASGYSGTRYGATAATGAVATTPSSASLYEIRFAVAATGSATFGLSISGGTESTSSSANARTPDAAFTASTMFVGLEAATGGTLSTIIQSVRVSTGVQTMATMRAG